MLVFSRKPQESIVIGDNIIIMVLSINERGDKKKKKEVKLGIKAPREVTVYRKEVYEAIKREEREKRDRKG
jgi:carbon storage regulator